MLFRKFSIVIKGKSSRNLIENNFLNRLKTTYPKSPAFNLYAYATRLSLFFSLVMEGKFALKVTFHNI